MLRLTVTLVGIICALCLATEGATVVKARRITRLERSINRETGAIDRQPVRTEVGFKYQLGIISDLDHKSKRQNVFGQDEWISYLLTGDLFLNYTDDGLNDPNLTISWREGQPQILRSNLNAGGRGMEFSELIVYKTQLLTCDDRTGILYRLIPSFDEDESIRWKASPWVILASGDGNASKGFKCEWALEKDGNLWIGSHGNKPDLVFVKEITPKGEVTHHNWEDNFRKMATAVGVTPPGYVIHEAGGWSETDKKWVFIPRKINMEKFIWEEDAYKAGNKIIVANEDFSNIETHDIAGELTPSHGISSFKWLPMAGNESRYIVALKAEEIGDSQASFILAFDMEGNTLFPETKIQDNKYEGLEFL